METNDLFVIPPYADRIEEVDEHDVPDTIHELDEQEWNATLQDIHRPQQHQEDAEMPRLNLKDDSLEGDAGLGGQDRDMATPPTLREVGGGGGSSPLILILIIIVVLAGGVFALNYFGIINLWGKKTPAAISDQLPEPDLPPPDWAETAEGGQAATGEDDLMAPSSQLPDAEVPEVTPPGGQAPGSQPTSSPITSGPSVTLPTSGSGDYTVQVSAWMSRTKADAEAAKLSTAGFDAYVEDAMVFGSTWYRVRVGRYASTTDAQQAASQLQSMMEGVVWVGKVGR
jgi:hypothetical protein